MSANETEPALAASLQLEQELDRAIDTFAYEHGELLRRACQIPTEQVNLIPVTVTTLFGHTLSRLLKARGRAATEKLALTLLEHFELAEARAAELRAGAARSKEAMH